MTIEELKILILESPRYSEEEVLKMDEEKRLIIMALNETYHDGFKYGMKYPKSIITKNKCGRVIKIELRS